MRGAEFSFNYLMKMAGLSGSLVYV